MTQPPNNQRPKRWATSAKRCTSSAHTKSRLPSPKPTTNPRTTTLRCGSSFALGIQRQHNGRASQGHRGTHTNTTHLFRFQRQVLPLQRSTFLLGIVGAKSGFSAFAARSSSPLVGSGIKPSSLGSSIGGHHSESASASSSAAPSSSTSAPAKPIVKGSTFGFGAFAGASPLAKPKSPAPTASPKEADKAEPSDDKATFEQKLLSEDKNAVAETKAKPLLEVSEESKSLHSHPLHTLTSC